jgi:hypothetical protein
MYIYTYTHTHTQGQGRQQYYQHQLAALALKNAAGELKKALDSNGCKLLKTGYKGGPHPAMFPWVDGLYSRKSFTKLNLFVGLY